MTVGPTLYLVLTEPRPVHRRSGGRKVLRARMAGRGLTHLDVLVLRSLPSPAGLEVGVASHISDFIARAGEKRGKGADAVISLCSCELIGGISFPFPPQARRPWRDPLCCLAGAGGCGNYLACPTRVAARRSACNMF